MSWIDAARESLTTETAERLGYEVKRGPTASHTKCPACGEERRHRKTRDRRGSVGMPHEGGWHCFTCLASGDAIDFVSWHVGGSRFRDLPEERRSEVRAWFDGGVASPRFDGSKVPSRLRKDQLPAEMENCDAAYPPISQVESLWESCVAVDADREVTGYLEKRDIAVSGVVEQDCARALPVGLVVPAWATYSSRPWNETGHRLLVPLFDHLGTMRSLLARSVAPNPEKKSVGASGGYHRRGLIMAATFGRQLLVSGPVRGLHRTENFRLTVFEGEVDFLRGAASGADCELSDAVSACGFRGAVGIVSGSFTRDIAARVPRHTTIVLATDDDAQGDKYASDITALVGTKANYERVRPEKD